MHTIGAPAVAQRVKNLTAAAWVPAEVGVLFLAREQQVKGSCCLELWYRLQVWLRSGVAVTVDSSPGLRISGAALKRKKKS